MQTTAEMTPSHCTDCSGLHVRFRVRYDVARHAVAVAAGAEWLAFGIRQEQPVIMTAIAIVVCCHVDWAAKVERGCLFNVRAVFDVRAVPLSGSGTCWC